MSGIINSIKNKIYYTFVDEVAIKEVTFTSADSIDNYFVVRREPPQYYKNGRSELIAIPRPARPDKVVQNMNITTQINHLNYRSEKMVQTRTFVNYKAPFNRPAIRNFASKAATAIANAWMKAKGFLRLRNAEMA